MNAIYGPRQLGKKKGKEEKMSKSYAMCAFTAQFLVNSDRFAYRVSNVHEKPYISLQHASIAPIIIIEEKHLSIGGGGRWVECGQEETEFAMAIPK